MAQPDRPEAPGQTLTGYADYTPVYVCSGTRKEGPGRPDPTAAPTTEREAIGELIHDAWIACGDIRFPLRDVEALAMADALIVAGVSLKGRPRG